MYRPDRVPKNQLGPQLQSWKLLLTYYSYYHPLLLPFLSLCFSPSFDPLALYLPEEIRLLD